MAVYCLQHLLKINWYELKEDYKKQVESNSNSQEILRRILKNKVHLKELQGLWMKKLEESKAVEIIQS